LGVFGDAFTTGTTALILLTFAEFANAATGICGPMIDMTGHTRVKVANSVLWTVLLIGGGALLIPRWGIVGAGIASLVAVAGVNVLTVIEVWALEALLPFDRTFWKPVTAGVVALVVGVTLDRLMPVGRDLVRATPQALVVIGVYAGLLLLFGLEPEDRLVFERGRHGATRLRRRRSSVPRPAIADALLPAVGSIKEATMPAARTEQPGPIYIGGLDRSGKTTMAAFLTSHPNIAIPAIGSNMWTYFYGQYGDLKKAANFERCLTAMMRYKHVSVLLPDAERIRREFADGPATYARLFALVHIHAAERDGKPRWGVQTGLIERYADQLFDAYPGVKIIHMVRDPRDRYEGSLALWPGGKGRAGGATARWTYSMRLAERNLRRHPDGYKIVRYEDMVQQPERTVREVCSFLGESFDPRMLQMTGAPERRERLRAQSSTAPTDVPLSPEFIGRFRGTIPEHEIAFMQLSAGRRMRAYGYERERLDMSAREWLGFTVVRGPDQFARMLAWRIVEGVQQRFPARAGRKPDPRLILKAPAGYSR
jgi:hypothetical protein